MTSTEPDTHREDIVPGPETLSHDPMFIEFAQQVFGGSEIADGLAPDQLVQLAAIGQMRVYDSGDLICDEHEHSDEQSAIRPARHARSLASRPGRHVAS